MPRSALRALLLGNAARALLFQVEPADPVSFVSTALILAAVALLARFIPAQRAANVDPIVALRYD